MGHANAVLLVLFVTGFVLFAYGTTHEDPGADARVDVSAVEDDEVSNGSEVVHYRNLSAPVREAFDRARESDSMGSVAVASSTIEVEYVEYDGEYYELDVRSGGGSGTLVELPLGLVGLVLSALSTVVYVLLRREAHD